MKLPNVTPLVIVQIWWFEFLQCRLFQREYFFMQIWLKRTDDSGPTNTCFIMMHSVFPIFKRYYVRHYFDVIMDAIGSQITSLTLFIQPFNPTQIKENIKAPRHWPLCGEFTGDRNAENVSIWWRHHDWTPTALSVFFAIEFKIPREVIIYLEIENWLKKDLV